LVGVVLKKALKPDFKLCCGGANVGAMGADPLGATTGESTFNIANTFGAPKTGEATKVGEAGGV
jgi:hypothetical protein